MADNNVNIGFTGDVMLGRTVNEKISETNYEYPWGDMLPLLKEMDINIINLENALTESTHKVSKVFNFKADPDKVQCLTEANVTIANIANNHILDFSEEGMLETIQVLDKNGIKHTGAGANAEKGSNPALVERNNVSVAVLGLTDNEPGWRAGQQKPGTNYIDILNETDTNKILEIIKNLAAQTDILAISIHWGPNMNERPQQYFIDFAHEMIHNGADIIHGHSAHIFQGIEIYQNKPILYDTGDFLDDYMVDPIVRNDRSFFFIVKADETGIKELKLVPTLISNYQVNKAKNADYKWAIRRMQQLSSEFDTAISDAGDVLFTEKAKLS